MADNNQFGYYEQLLSYYEKELTFIREMGAEFAQKHPKIAGRLLLEPDRCEDPHTERLIEAFAFLSARIHKKIDDNFPEIVEALFTIIYPHYIKPVPSMSIIQFDPKKQNIPPQGEVIEKNMMLDSRPVTVNEKELRCQFSTCYPVTIWPVDVVSANVTNTPKAVMGAEKAILIQLKSLNNIPFSQLPLDKLRFFLHGPAHHSYHLYELLFNNIINIDCEFITEQGRTKSFTLSPSNIEAVGFSPDEALIPFQKRSFPGYRLMFEYFCFPDKFLFFDLTGLNKMAEHNVNETIDIWIYLNKKPKEDLTITKDTFCLNAAPAVNLFKRSAEPIRVEYKKPEYRVIPDISRQEGTEIFTIDRVKASIEGAPEETVDFKPFYSLNHFKEQEGPGRYAFWYSKRRVAPQRKSDSWHKRFLMLKGRDSDTEVFLSFFDSAFSSVDPKVEIVRIQTTCTNRDIPSRLSYGHPQGDFYPSKPLNVVNQIKSIVKPTSTRRPFLDRELQWRLISHLSLNYLSLVEGDGEGLREILALYDFDDSPTTRQQINGITSVKPQYITKRIGKTFCRGVQVTLEFDESKYVGAGLFLFASVIERFLGQYVSLNSFTQLVAQTKQSKRILKKWPPRSGDQTIL